MMKIGKYLYTLVCPRAEPEYVADVPKKNVLDSENLRVLRPYSF